MPEMEIERRVRHKEDLPPFTRKLSESLRPRYIGLMRTTHTPDTMRKMVEQKLASLDIPAEAKAGILPRLVEQFAKASGGKQEYHSLIVVEDTANKRVFALANEVRGEAGKLERENDDIPRVLDERVAGEGEIEGAIAGMLTTFAVARTTADWKGTRDAIVDCEVSTLAEANAIIDKAGMGEAWRLLFSQESEAREAIPEVAPDKEKELVARFGEKAIADLKRKIAYRKKLAKRGV